MAENDHTTLHNFTQLLQQLDGGSLVPTLSNHVQDIVGNLNDVRADEGGEPTATITMKVKFKLTGDIVEVTPEVKVEQPKRTAHKTPLWTTEGNKLSLANPRQQTMQFADVGGGRRAAADA